MDGGLFEKLGVAGIVITILIGCILWFWPMRTEKMVIRSMKWHREVREYEDYNEYVCHTRTRTKSGGTPESYRDCNWEGKTRITNRWPTSGAYPGEPYWYEGYIIQPGRYEGRWEQYKVWFSDDRELYSYSTGNYAEYQGYKPRQSHTVSVNSFGFVISVKD